MKKVRITYQRVFHFDQIVEMEDVDFEALRDVDQIDLMQYNKQTSCIEQYLDFNDMSHADDLLENFDAIEVDP